MGNKVNAALRMHGLLLGVLALGLLVRWWFMTGIAYGEARWTAETAWQIAEGLRAGGVSGLAALRAEFGLQTLARHLPRAGLYAVFGVQDWTTFALPLLISLVNIGLAYRLGWQLGGRRAAFLAGLFWSVLPGEVFYATTLTAVPLLSLVGVLGFNALWRTDFIRLPGWLWPAALAGWVAGLALFSSPDEVLAGLSWLFNRPEGLLLLPAGLAALARRTDANARWPDLVVLGWLAVVAGLVWQGGEAERDWIWALLSLAWLGPALLAAHWLATFIPERRLARWGWVSVVGLALAARLAIGFEPLSAPRYENFEWLWRGQFVNVLLIGRGLTLIGLLALVWLVSRAWARRVRAPLGMGVAVGVCVSLLVVVQAQVGSWRAQAARWQAGLEWARSELEFDRVAVGGNEQRLLLNTAGGFRLADELRLTRLGEDWASQTEGLVALGEEELLGQSIPANWLRVYTVGRPETPRLAVFLAGDDGQTCEDVLSWLAANGGAVPLAPDSVLCAERVTGANLVEGGVAPANQFLGGYMVMNDRGEGIWSMYHKYFMYRDGRTFDLSVTLEPDSVYLLRVRLKSEHPITALYYRAGDTESAYGWVHPQEWTSYTLVISTAGWGDAQSVAVMPFLANNHSRVDVQDFQLQKLGE